MEKISSKRRDAEKWLPKIVRPAEGHYSICKISDIVGKTVARVEFGFRADHRQVHQSEAIILHFTDGSSLGIQTGSNAQNLASEYKGLKPEDFHVDIDLQWVPPAD